MIDLHLHSNCSDGDRTPGDLAREVAEAGLYAAVLTDHDTVDGVPAFRTAAETAGVRALSGVEISAEWNPGTMHMLGYGIEPECAELQDALDRMRRGRLDRNDEIINRLRERGMELTREEVESHAEGDVIGRPHIARAMIRKGYVQTKEQAFSRWLAKGRPGYVPRFRLTSRESVELIRRAGGLPVLAHPATLEIGRKKLKELVEEMKGWGLAGIEAYYSEHSAKKTAEYLRLARSLDLLTTGGSDFHGSLNPAVRIGAGFGELDVPDACFDALAARLG